MGVVGTERHRPARKAGRRSSWKRVSKEMLVRSVHKKLVKVVVKTTADFIKAWFGSNKLRRPYRPNILKAFAIEPSGPLPVYLLTNDSPF